MTLSVGFSGFADTLLHFVKGGYCLFSQREGSFASQRRLSTGLDKNARKYIRKAAFCTVLSS